MLTKLVQIGTSKGIRIPSSIIKALGLKSEIDIAIKGKTIVLKAHKKAREGWAEKIKASKAVLTKEDKDWLALTEEGTEEWEWKEGK